MIHKLQAERGERGRWGEKREGGMEEGEEEGGREGEERKWGRGRRQTRLLWGF